jgi:hypothetical protein
VVIGLQPLLGDRGLAGLGVSTLASPPGDADAIFPGVTSA